MQTPTPSHSRQRRCSDQHPFGLEGGACQTASKKSKAVHTPDPSQPTTYQEESSVVPLERHALRELNRRNIQAARESRAKQQRVRRRPATRLTVAEWKRCHRPLESVYEYLQNCGQEQYRALQSFSKHGGPDLWDLRGCQRAATRSANPMHSSHASSIGRLRSRSTKTKATTESGTSKSLSPYNRAFQQVLVDARVYPPHYEHPGGRAAPEPENWNYINHRLAQPRASLSPSEFSKEQHRAFIRQDASAAKEDQVKKKVIPLIEGTIKDPRTTSGDIPFTNLDPLIIADENLASGKPDFFHGARPEKLDRRIRSELERSIIPSTQHDLPIVPTHFTAAKGPDGSAAVANRQVTYDTFFGSRGFHALQNYGHAEPRYDMKAYTIGTTYHNGLLQLFTSHPVPPANSGEPPSYYMNPLRSFAMRDTVETWRAGATWYRNSIDWTSEERDEAIRVANELLNQQSSVNSSITPNATTSFASTGSQQLGLGLLTMESQVETMENPNSEDFQTAASSQDEANADGDEDSDEDECGPSVLLPSKRPGKDISRRHTTSRKKRRRESVGNMPSFSEEAAPKASAPKKGKEGGRGRGKKPVR